VGRLIAVLAGFADVDSTRAHGSLFQIKIAFFAIFLLFSQKMFFRQFFHF
jgi:hypothetical protein